MDYKSKYYKYNFESQNSTSSKDYFSLYKKYKNKYLNLKNQFAGSVSAGESKAGVSPLEIYQKRLPHVHSKIYELGSCKAIINYMNKNKVQFSDFTKINWYRLIDNIYIEGYQFNYTNSFNEDGKNIFRKGTLMLNGIKRVNEMPYYYYDSIQPYQNFIASPSTGINLYSFSLGSKIYQPSGSCNMSQFDQIKLVATLDSTINRLNKARFKAYALSYNVLRIIDGYGGLNFTI